MTTRTRKFLCSLFLLLLVLAAVAPFVSAVPQKVFDEADLLTESQIASLEEQMNALISQLDLDLVVVTTDDTGGKTSRAYADDFYDNGGFGVGSDKRGVLFLIDMDNRQAYLSTCGKGIDYLTDARIDRILDGVVAKLKAEDYYGAAQVFLSKTKGYVKSGVPDNQYRYDEDTGKVTSTQRSRALTGGEVLLCLGMGLTAGLITAGIVAVKYKLKYKESAYPYREKSRVRMTDREDIFVRRYITSHRIETHSGGGGSSGGSSTHSSSSGSTHGGGGRGF